MNKKLDTVLNFNTKFENQNAQALEDFFVKLQYLLNNKRFIFEDNKLFFTTNSSTIIASILSIFESTSSTVSTILQSRLCKTNFYFNVFDTFDIASDNSIIYIKNYIVIIINFDFENFIVDIFGHRSKFEIFNFILEIAI